MEWVETTGRSVDEAKDLALDQLGVDEQDAEFEVVEEPRTGLFGRTRGEARVRARVRPRAPRPKVERRGGRPGGPRGQKSGMQRKARGTSKRPETAAAGTNAVGAASSSRPAAKSPARGAGARPAAGGRRRSRDHDDEQETTTMSETELAEQGEVVRGFLVDLLDAFGLEGTVAATPVADDDAVELTVEGDDLGLLIGPKGATLQAVQELSRSVLQRQRPGESHARIRVDVSGYRARRKVALEAFVRKVAADVLESGTQKALEPMSPPDRKVVHDTVNDIDGVHTISEGEDSRRRVVLIPDA